MVCRHGALLCRHTSRSAYRAHHAVAIQWLISIYVNIAPSVFFLFSICLNSESLCYTIKTTLTLKSKSKNPCGVHQHFNIILYVMLSHVSISKRALLGHWTFKRLRLARDFVYTKPTLGMECGLRTRKCDWN